MIGARPLTNEEVNDILNNFKNARDKCLFILGLKTGFRISELLSIKVIDVVQYDKIQDSVTVTRANMKGSKSSRTVKLHIDAKEALAAMGVLTMNKSERLFPIERQQAHRILKEAATKAKVSGKVSTHSLRKTFAKKVHDLFEKDIVKTQKALGHASLSSTAHYLQFDQKEIDDAILSI